MSSKEKGKEEGHSAMASWIRSYFKNVMTKSMINNRTDA